MKTECIHPSEHTRAAEKIKTQGLGYTQAEVEQVCTVFRMLSEPTRMRLVLALKESDLCVYHLTEACGSTQSAVSHQLRVLRDNKIVKAKRVGQSVEYSIADDHVKKIVEMALAHLGCKTEE